MASGNVDEGNLTTAESALQAHKEAVDKIISHLDNNPDLTDEQKVDAVASVFGLSFDAEATIEEKKEAFKTAKAEFRAAFKASMNPAVAQFAKSKKIVGEARALITELGWGDGAKMSDRKVIDTLYSRSTNSLEEGSVERVKSVRGALRNALDLEADATTKVTGDVFQAQKNSIRKILEPVARFVATHKKSTAVAVVIAGLAYYFKGDDIWSSLFDSEEENHDQPYNNGATPSQQPEVIDFGSDSFEVPRPTDGMPWKLQQNLEKISTGRYKISWSQSDGSSRSDIIAAEMVDGALQVSIERDGTSTPLRKIR